MHRTADAHAAVQPGTWPERGGVGEPVLDDLRLLRGRIARRLAIAWVALSLALGAGGLAIEHARLTRYVGALASSAGRDLIEHWPAIEGASSPNHEQRARALLDRYRFDRVRIVDGECREIFQVRRPDAVRAPPETAAARCPPASGRRHRMVLLDGQRFVQLTMPVALPDGQAGWLEGLYRVDPALAEVMRLWPVHTALIVALVVGVASLVFYPVVLSLNRGTLLLARRLLDSYLDLTAALGRAIAKRDSDTGAHNYRVTLYAVALAEALRLPAQNMTALIVGSYLHDVGKIGIPDRILLKPAPLTPEEAAAMRGHPGLGDEIIRGSPWLAQAREIILHHHERYDGSGYPDGLKGEAIPSLARLFAVADMFDALASARPYKPALPLDRCIGMLRDAAGTQLDPRMVSALAGIAPPLHRDYAQASESALQAALAGVVTRYVSVHSAAVRAPQGGSP